jgi:hypothetical protein
VSSTGIEEADVPGYTRRQILAGLGAFAGLPKARSRVARLARERAIAILQET